MREALKLALEAFDDRSSLMKWQEARDAVKEALAQPEQEFVARIVEHRATVKLEWASADAAHNAKVGNLYTTPPQRKEPEQEPVAWMFQHEETGQTMCVDAQQLEWGFEKANPRLKKIAPLYTTPPQRKPLPYEQIEEKFCKDRATTYVQDAGDFDLFRDGVRYAEAAHGIKE